VFKPKLAKQGVRGEERGARKAVDKTQAGKKTNEAAKKAAGKVK
jgi:hypothetical protein